MESRRLDKTSVDYLVIALAPGLIMGLVGSLVLFLLEVSYYGQYVVRLSWILSLFVFAAVLIARISISQGTAYAGVYGAVLALVTAVAMFRFVDQPLIGCLLLAVIWWCTHKLTWDCTLIDEQEEDSGQGVLESAGLDYEAPANRADAEQRELARSVENTRRPRWRELIRGLVEQDRRPHAPGVWVVYFSLAALPLFGLGQLLIPTSDAARRDNAFLLLCIYLACGLALLLVTSFLGLRRYLRQRRLEMPVTMTGVWMGAGAAMIVLLLAFAAVLPSPGGAAQWTLPKSFKLDSPQRAASRAAVPRDDGAQGEGAESRATDGQSENESGSDGEGNPPRDDDSGQPSEQDSDTTAEARVNENGKRKENPNDEEPDEPPSGGTGKPRPGAKRNAAGQSSQSRTGSPPASGNRFSLPQLSLVAGSWLKWLVYLVLGVVVIYMCIRHWNQVRSWITQIIDELRGIWNALFGRRGRKVTIEEPESAPAVRPFAEFSNPFQDGAADRRSPDELVRYSFAALEAWATEYGGGRPPELTPLELAARLSRGFPKLAEETQQLAALYARLAYAGQSLSPKCLGTVRKFWKRLEEATEATILSREVVKAER